MSHVTLAAIAASVICLGGTAFYIFAMPASDAAVQEPAPVPVQALTTPTHAIDAVHERTLSPETRNLIAECRGPLRRRGIPSGEGTKAMEVCTCVARNIASQIGSRDSFKLAGYYFEPAFAHDQKSKQIKRRFDRRAKAIAGKMKSHRKTNAVTKAVSGAMRACRVGKRLGFKLAHIRSFSWR